VGAYRSSEREEFGCKGLKESLHGRTERENHSGWVGISTKEGKGLAECILVGPKRTNLGY